MELNEYQKEAQATDRKPLKERGIERFDLNTVEFMVPMLGLSSEAGDLLGTAKKRLRDGGSFGLFKERIVEDLGDCLWYLTNVAYKFDITLQEIASANLNKTQHRWNPQAGRGRALFDDAFPVSEQLPRHLEIRMVDGDAGKVKMFAGGKQIGNDLTDNRYDEADGYRFHDVFHWSYACILGWSPVVRTLFYPKLKRKSNQKVDEVEDGGRAIAIEEGISAMVFSYAADHKYLSGVHTVDYYLLRAIKAMTSHLEVSDCSESEWEKAILAGFRVWRAIKRDKGGKFRIDMRAATIKLVTDSVS